MKSEIKMSDVLVRYSADLFERFEGYKKRHSILHLSAAAWNMSFTSEEERQSLIDDAMSKFKLLDLDDQESMRVILEDLIRKKLTDPEFKDDYRMIVNLDISLSKDQTIQIDVGWAYATNKKTPLR
jgi:hypothetical protein